MSREGFTLPGSESREKIKAEDAWNYLEERFKVSEKELSGFKIIKKSGDFWITSKQDDPDLDYETIGIRFLRDTGKYLKPTTYGLQILGNAISSAITEVSQSELEILLDGDMIERNLEIEKGYIALLYEGEVVGCGLYKDELVSSRISRGRAGELRELL